MTSGVSLTGKILSALLALRVGAAIQQETSLTRSNKSRFLLVPRTSKIFCPLPSMTGASLWTQFAAETHSDTFAESRRAGDTRVRVMKIIRVKVLLWREDLSKHRAGARMPSRPVRMRWSRDLPTVCLVRIIPRTGTIILAPGPDPLHQGSMCPT